MKAGASGTGTHQIRIILDIGTIIRGPVGTVHGQIFIHRQMKTRAAAKIRVQYRPDSYGGPTVVVDLHDEMGLHGLRDIFFRLATGELSELDLQEQESVAVLSPIE